MAIKHLSSETSQLISTVVNTFKQEGKITLTFNRERSVVRLPPFQGNQTHVLTESLRAQLLSSVQSKEENEITFYDRNRKVYHVSRDVVELAMETIAALYGSQALKRKVIEEIVDCTTGVALMQTNLAVQLNHWTIVQIRSIEYALV